MNAMLPAVKHLSTWPPLSFFSLAAPSNFKICSERSRGLPEQKKPTRAELQALTGKIVPDHIGPNLRILLVGINPSLYTAYTGFPFAFPGNRFWPTLYNSGLTDRLYAPSEVADLLEQGIGITGMVRRATATA